MTKKKIILFGLGKIYETFLKLVDNTKAEIIALSDNNTSLLNKNVENDVVCPGEIRNLEFDYVIVTSKYFSDIKKQLTGYQIEEERILDFYEIYKKMTIKNNYPLIELLKDNISFSADYKHNFENIQLMGEKNLFLNAKNFINTMKSKRLTSLEESEFQVYSQFGEDGIIQWLIHNAAIEERTFIEFGVEDYTEANTRFLLMNNNWTGFVMDGSEEHIRCLKSWKFMWKYDLLATAAFITKDNINQLITEAGFGGDIGILSIDLDGNDYWILNAIDCVTPRILICEYNGIYGEEQMVSVPYDESFVRNRAHYSNLYWGASIAAYRDWAERNGYYYMGSNSAGNNAFFVRKDCITPDKIPANADVFVESKYRESRDKDGELTYLHGRERLQCIKEMKLVELNTNQIDTIANIYNI